MKPFGGATQRVATRYITPLNVCPPFALWLVDLTVELGSAAIETLSADEVAKGLRFVFERDRQRYFVAHVALREVLARQLATLPSAIRYVDGPFGKPTLLGNARLGFNLSHSGDVALIATAPGEDIGVDVEVLRPIENAVELAERNFMPAERDEVERAAMRDAAFLRCWTRKEACLKAIGSGLSIAPETFEAGTQAQTRVVRIATPAGTARVEVHSLAHLTDAIGAIARTLPE